MNATEIDRNAFYDLLDAALNVDKHADLKMIAIGAGAASANWLNDVLVVNLIDGSGFSYTK